MGEARRMQEAADRSVREAERALAVGDQRRALEWLRTALRYRPWDKLTTSKRLDELWGEQG